MNHDGHEFDGGPVVTPEMGHEVVRAMWHAHRRWVAALLLAHMPREADLEDLLQDVAMAMVKHAANLKDPALVRPWLRTIAINTARTAGRRTKVRRRVFPRLAGADDRLPEPVSVRQDQSSSEEGRRALELAQRLPEEYREPLLLRAVRGMSYRQIADVLGLPITTVETRLTRARRMLRRQMEAEAPHGRDQTPVGFDAAERGEP